MSASIENYYFGALLGQAAYGDYGSVNFKENGYGIDEEVNDVLTSKRGRRGKFY